MVTISALVLLLSISVARPPPDEAQGSTKPKSQLLTEPAEEPLQPPASLDEEKAKPKRSEVVPRTDSELPRRSRTTMERVGPAVLAGASSCLLGVPLISFATCISCTMCPVGAAVGTAITTAFMVTLGTWLTEQRLEDAVMPIIISSLATGAISGGWATLVFVSAWATGGGFRSSGSPDSGEINSDIALAGWLFVLIVPPAIAVSAVGTTITVAMLPDPVIEDDVSENDRGSNHFEKEEKALSNRKNSGQSSQLLSMAF